MRKGLGSKLFVLPETKGAAIQHRGPFFVNEISASSARSAARRAKEQFRSRKHAAALEAMWARTGDAFSAPPFGFTGAGF